MNIFLGVLSIILGTFMGKKLSEKFSKRKTFFDDFSNFNQNLNTDYIYVSSSNDIEFPNDRILLDILPDKINFKNVKTNEITVKDICTMPLIEINKIYKVKDFYKKFYKDEILEEFDKKTLINSSSSWN